MFSSLFTQICINILVSIIILFLIHHIFNHFKNTYTKPINKDLVNTQIIKYKQIIKELQEPKTNQIPVIQENDIQQLNNELYEFMQQHQ